MRTIVINEKLTINIDALTRRQIEALKEKGHNVTTMHIGVTPEKWDDFTDALLSAYCDEQTAKQAIEAIKDLPKEEYRKVSLELIAETWGSEAEEKN